MDERVERGCMNRNAKRGCMNEISGLSFDARLTLETLVTNIDRAAKMARYNEHRAPQMLATLHEPSNSSCFSCFYLQYLYYPQIC